VRSIIAWVSCVPGSCESTDYQEYVGTGSSS